MRHDATSPMARKLIDRLNRLAILVTSLSVMGLVAAALWPVPSGAGDQAAPAHSGLGSLATAPRDLREILNGIVGRPLIRPGQVTAAVKKTGAAERLAKQLKLHGIVMMPDGPAAYIAVANEGVVDVRAGGQVLEFSVKKIDSGTVTLSLDGEEVQLRN